jgi:hypothetical protein
MKFFPNSKECLIWFNLDFFFYNIWTLKPTGLLKNAFVLTDMVKKISFPTGIQITIHVSWKEFFHVVLVRTHLQQSFLESSVTYRRTCMSCTETIIKIATDFNTRYESIVQTTVSSNFCTFEGAKVIFLYPYKEAASLSFIRTKMQLFFINSLRIPWHPRLRTLLKFRSSVVTTMRSYKYLLKSR